MAAYAIIEVHVCDIADYLAYQQQIAPLLESVGARYLARGGEYRNYEDGEEPGRLILVEFPSMAIMDQFYASEAYQALKPQRDACSQSRIVAVEGL